MNAEATTETTATEPTRRNGRKTVDAVGFSPVEADDVAKGKKRYVTISKTLPSGVKRTFRATGVYGGTPDERLQLAMKTQCELKDSDPRKTKGGSDTGAGAVLTVAASRRLLGELESLTPEG